MMARTVAAALFAGAAAAANAALACASCGSGGDSPLVLYPNEKVKAYVGTTRQGGFKTVTADGRVGSDLGPKTKDTVVAAVGASFLTDWFATITVPHVTNEREGRSRSGFGDPLLSLTWTVVPASLARPAMPQVQLSAAQKRAISTSVENSDDDNFLDVYGSGFDESRLGADFWWGSETVKAGFAVVGSHSYSHAYGGESRAPGNGVRLTATTGYGFGDMGKLVVGAIEERDGERTQADASIKDSDVVTNSLFASADAMIAKTQMLRLSFTKLGAFGKNKNTNIAQAVTFAWMGSL